jgi:hypothetical protein
MPRLPVGRTAEPGIDAPFVDPEARRSTKGWEALMRYMLMIWDREADWAAKTDAERQEVYRGHRQLVDDLQGAQQYLGSNELVPASSATCVRTRNGKVLLTDGPYAESAEQIGGYYLVEARDLDEAIRVAARIPVSPFATIEVRPVVSSGT